jgi:ADP-ribosylglycohydrolase
LRAHIIEKASAMDAGILAHVAPAFEGDLDSLELDDEESMGYTLKTLGAALWALFHAEDFESGVTEIINRGGDADTNAAVAGALLGARDGEEAIPGAWIRELRWREYMDRMAGELIKLLESSEA